MVSYQNSQSDFPGVEVRTGGTDAAYEGMELSERDIYACLICIVATKAVYTENGMLMMDLRDAVDAMLCLGYSHFEARPMLQTALGELAELEELHQVSLIN